MKNEKLESPHSFESILKLINYDIENPLVIMSAGKLVHAHHTSHAPNHSLLIHGVENTVQINLLYTLLSTLYSKEHPIKIIKAGSAEKINVIEANLGDLLTWAQTNGAVWLFITPLESTSSFQEFQEIIARLRAPDGCPWDKEQTHSSLRNNLLEETYEALDTLDNQNVEGMREEFGDLLLQIVLHAQIATESSEFRMEDVIAGISNKLIRRHPHVFGNDETATVKGVLQNWEKLKEMERADKGTPEKGILDGVPVGLPALTQAQELQDRAARVGFDWPSIEPVWEKVYEELEEVRQAKTPAEVEKELGDLIFALVNVVRWNKVDAESALRGTNQKFRRRFKHIEQSSRKNGQEMRSMTLDEMDKYWNEAKGKE